MSAGLVCASLGCGEKPAKGEGCDMLPGDLVISEIMAAPEGGVRDDEWFEVYNASGTTLNLNRMVLAAAGSGDVRELVVRDGGSLEPGQYFVFGAGPASLPFVDYSYGNTLDRSPFSLTNSNGLVRLSCKGQLIDEVAYGDRGDVPSPTPGRSLSFDGGVAPDPVLNKRGEWWCSAGETYDGVNIGTPRQRNVLCGFARCYDDEGERDVVAPAPGDLVISEVFADPAGADTKKEWLEVFVAAEQPVDLNALTVMAVNTSGNGQTYSGKFQTNECVRAHPGDYVVLGGSTDPEENGNAPVHWAVPGLDRHNGVFFNGSHTIELWRADLLIDRAVVPASKAGISLMLDAALLSTDENENVNAFCDASVADGGFFDGLGTPGAANRLCGVLTCRQGDNVRKIVPPIAGEIVINEVMAELSGSDSNREYIEFYVTSAVPVDLNGLEISNRTETSTTRRAIVAQESCVTAQLGDYVVIGQTADVSLNGGLHVDGVAPIDFFNGAALHVEVRSFGELLDYAQLPQSVPSRATTLRPANQNTADNDFPESFCFAETRGVFADRGTPGFANVCGPSCLEAGVPRVANPPAPGELLITEVATRFTGGAECKQWFEVFALVDVDLNGLHLEGGQYTNVLEPVACATVLAGHYGVVGARDAVNQPSLWPSGVGLTAELRCLSTAPLYSASTAGTERFISLWLGATPITETPNYAPMTLNKSFSMNAQNPALVLDPVDSGNWCHGAAPTPGTQNICP